MRDALLDFNDIQQRETNANNRKTIDETQIARRENALHEGQVREHRVCDRYSNDTSQVGGGRCTVPGSVGSKRRRPVAQTSRGT